MAEHSVEISLAASGVEASRAAATLTIFTPAQRLKRTAAVMGIAILMAAMLLPIPIIHLVGPPIILLTGLVTALRQLRATERLSPTIVRCPKCGGENRVGGGLGGRRLGEPSQRYCEDCRRVLTMAVTTTGDR